MDTKRFKLVNSVSMVFRDDSTLFLELGEAASIDASSPATRVAMLDAPKWFQRIENESESAGGNLSNSDYGSLPNLTSDLEQSLYLPPGGALLHSTNLCAAEQEEEGQVDEERDVEYRTSLSRPQDDYLVIEDTNAEGNNQQVDLDPSDPLVSSLPLLPPVLCDVVAGKTSEEILSTFQRVHDNHFDALMIQLVQSLGLSLTWIGVIKPLVIETCQQVRTNLLPDDVMDINHYIKVKKIPGGKMADSAYIYGVVCSKNVTHKKMRTSLDNPTIMLLRCAFEFQRKENQFSALDTLQLQEHEYLKNVVAKIKKFHPSIILVQKSVSRIALDMLHDLGVVVAVNVKPMVMNKVARSTNATLLHSLDQLSFDVRLGTCGQFYIRSFALPDGCKKTLMYFDRCDPASGCVITLRGGELRELKKVKKVAQFALHMAYNSFLESSFLADGFAWPLDCEPKPIQASTVGYHSTPSTPEWPLYAVEVPANDRAPAHLQDLNDKLTTLVEAGSTHDLAALPDDDQATTAAAAVSRSDDDVELKRDLYHHIDSGLSPEDQFRSALDSLILSISPNTGFSVPYLLTQRGTEADLTQYLHSTKYWSNRFKPHGGGGCQEGDDRDPKVLGASPDVEARCSPLATSRDQPSPSTTTTTTAMTCASPCHGGSRRGYRSVSEHPFTSSIFVTKAGSSDMKAVLADYRARAGPFCEDGSFFFPSARKSSDYRLQVSNLFAKYRQFEAKAAATGGRGFQAPPLSPSSPSTTMMVTAVGPDPQTGQSGEDGGIVYERDCEWGMLESLRVEDSTLVLPRSCEVAASTEVVPAEVVPWPVGNVQKGRRSVEPLAMKMEFASLGDIDGNSSAGKQAEGRREGEGKEEEERGEEETTGEQLVLKRKSFQVRGVCV